MSMPRVTTPPSEGLQRLLDEGRFVCMLARTLVADEADEVVQQTWLRAIQHGGDDVAEPRSWLARIVRNVATNVRCRRARRRHHETEAAASLLVPSSAELMVREEQRRILVAAVDGLPAQLRSVVLLRYIEGLPPRRIAAELRMPVTAVWNRLREALQALRKRLDAQHGGQRRAWLLPLVPFAAAARKASWLAPATSVATIAVGTGVFAIMKAKFVALGVVLLAIGGAIAVWPQGAPALGNAPDGGAGKHLAAELAATRPAGAGGDRPGVLERELVATATPAAGTTGTLLVRVRHSDKTPAARVTIIVYPRGGYALNGRARCSSDDAGRAHFESLPAGRFVVIGDRGGSAFANVVAGTATEVDLELPAGVMLNGIVVDSVGAPVAGALVEGAPRSRSGVDVEVLATSGPDGRFHVRAAPEDLVVGARAAGHCSSPLQLLHGKTGEPIEVRLQLGAPAGTVNGVVVDTRNRAIAGADVCVGRGSTSQFNLGGFDRAPPIPALVRTDGAGRFVAVGIPPGTQPVAARARGKGPLRTTCEVQANLTSTVRIELADGAVIEGIVRDAEGVPVAGAEVEVGEWADFAHYSAVTAADGQFALVDLPAGSLSIRAKHDTAGRAEQSVATASGSVAHCDIQLSRGIELRGRVVDEQGAPLAGAGIAVLALNLASPWSAHAHTDQSGNFVVPSCPSGEKLALRVNRQGFAEATQQNVDPTAGPIEVRLRRVAAAATRVRGVVVDPTGIPLPGVRIWAFGPVRDGTCAATTGADGRFELGPLVPGSWSLTARSSSYPIWRSEPFELGGEAVHDLGQVQMPAGGTAVVQVDGDRSNLKFKIVDAKDTANPLTDTGAKLESSPLAPGAYRLLVHGNSVAAESVPFTVRAGEETAVRVTPRPGVRQQFVVTGSMAPMGVIVHVRRGTALIAIVSLMARGGGFAPGEVWLAPGDYEASIRTTPPQTGPAHAFTVGTTEGPSVSLVLQ